MQCSECHGRGKYLDAPGNALDGPAYWETCPACGGSGETETREICPWCHRRATRTDNLGEPFCEHCQVGWMPGMDLSTPPEEEGRMITIDDIRQLGERFNGVDIQFRRPVPAEWSGAWRLRLCASKNEREDYRHTTFGDTFETAAQALLNLVVAADEVTS